MEKSYAVEGPTLYILFAPVLGSEPGQRPGSSPVLGSEPGQKPGSRFSDPLRTRHGGYTSSSRGTPLTFDLWRCAIYIVKVTAFTI